jgi:plasmid maintenance system antidote protein VapI
MALDFTRATDLFMGSEQELALALGISVADVRELRTNPRRVTPELMDRLGNVLMERGSGMKRVGEMLRGLDRTK